MEKEKDDRPVQGNAAKNTVHLDRAARSRPFDLGRAVFGTRSGKRRIYDRGAERNQIAGQNDHLFNAFDGDGRAALSRYSVDKQIEKSRFGQPAGGERELREKSDRTAGD